MSFSTLGLSDKVLAAVEAAGYTTPTPIQSQAIPIVLQRRDVVGIAQTGTGKTAGFVLPMMTILEKGRARARMPRTLILEPTRELAAQVEENFNKYGINQKLTVALLIGGVSFEDQIKKLDRGVDVLIATPGRLLDHFERGRLLMTGVEILVIDEADRMLDMGFIPDIERICKMIPPSRQTLMFSATMPPEIKRLADLFLRDPIRVETGRPATTAKTVTQRLVKSGREAHDKRDVLRNLVNEAVDLKNAIIFCNRKRDVAVVYKSLEKHGFNVGALHGDMDQRARTAMLDGFRGGKLTLLVASDVAARGLDIPDVSHVYNYDVPIHAEDYVHRIGRTGRAGRSGTAISIVTDLDLKHVGAIEKLTGEPLEWMGEPTEAGSAPSGSDRRRSGGERSSGERSGEREGGRGPRRGRSAPSGDRAERPSAEAPRAAESARPAAPVRVAEAEAVETETASEPRRNARPRRDRNRGETPAPDGARAAPEPARATPVRPDSVRPQHSGRPERGPAPRPDQGGSSHQSGRPARSDRHHQDHEPPVVGLGDHVPAFLLRPTRPARSAT